MSANAVFMMEYAADRIGAARSTVETLWWTRGHGDRFGSVARGRCDERFFNSGDAIECHIGYLFGESDYPDFFGTAGALFEISGRNLMYFRDSTVAGIDVDLSAATEAEMKVITINELPEYMPDMSDVTYYRILAR